METTTERVAGLDVHKDTVVACVRVPGPGGRREGHSHEFPTTTAGLLALRDWLSAHAVTLAGMEATGTYWKPVYYVLEDDWLLNARRLRNVPGRKTDTADAAWICQLMEHGLVRPSFVPPKPIRDLRNLTRYRKAQIEERTRESQRLDKVLQDAGIKLSSVASNLRAVSAQAMLRALVGGEHDPEILAELAASGGAPPARDRDGCGCTSPRRPRPPAAPRAPTCRPSTPAFAAGAQARGRPSPWPTRSWWPPSTSSSAARPMRIWAPTGSSAATLPSAAPAPSALVGAIVVIASDFLALHLLPGGVQVPAGVVTGLIGAPYLLWLLAVPGHAGDGR